MDQNKYVVEDDSEILNAGYTVKSRYDTEREAVIAELKQYSHKTIIGTYLLCFFFGLSGFHHFANRRFLLGLLYFLTVGFFGIGWIVDQVKIIAGKFKDGDGKYINDPKVMRLRMKLDEIDRKYAGY